MRGGTCVLIVVLVAGCATPATDDDGSEGTPTPQPAIVLPWSYDCDRAGYAPATPDVCVTGFADPAAAITEPSIAVFPGEPDVLAVGVNRHDSANVLLDAPDRGRPQLVETEVWFSGDGGSTWTRTQPPDIPEASSASEVDPSLAFDANGTLHYTALMEGGSGDPYVYYTSTADQGATWTTPETLAHGGTSGTIDRNWLSLGPDGTIYVTWQAYAAGGGVAMSRDGGTTWTKTGADEIPCVRESPVAALRDHAIFACQSGIVADIVHLVYALDANGTWTERASLPLDDCDGPLVAPAGDLVVLLCRTDMLTSADGGHTWSAPLDLLALATVEDGWPATLPYAIAADSRGLAHVLLGSRDGREAILPERNPVIDERVAHIVLDPRTGVLHHEARLTSSDPAQLRRVPPVLVPAIADDYFGLAATPSGMYLAWTRDRGIDVAHAATINARAAGAAIARA